MSPAARTAGRRRKAATRRRVLAHTSTPVAPIGAHVEADPEWRAFVGRWL